MSTDFLFAHKKQKVKQYKHSLSPDKMKNKENYKEKN